jgi:hypothetical protein
LVWAVVFFSFSRPVWSLGVGRSLALMPHLALIDQRPSNTTGISAFKQSDMIQRNAFASPPLRDRKRRDTGGVLWDDMCESDALLFASRSDRPGAIGDPPPCRAGSLCEPTKERRAGTLSPYPGG